MPRREQYHRPYGITQRSHICPAYINAIDPKERAIVSSEASMERG